MTAPVITFNGDGTLTVCCGEGVCAELRVATSAGRAPAVGGVSAIQPTPLRPTFAYRDFTNFVEAGRSDLIAGNVQQYGEGDVVAMAVALGSEVRLDLLNALASEHGVTPMIMVGATVDAPAPEPAYA